MVTITKNGCGMEANIGKFAAMMSVIHGAVAGGKCYKHGEATACVIDGCTNPVKYSKNGCCETHLTNKRKHIKTKF